MRVQLRSKSITIFLLRFISTSKRTDSDTMLGFLKFRSNRGRSNVLPGGAPSDVALSDLDAQSSLDMAGPDEPTDNRAIEAGATNRVSRSVKASLCLKLTVFVGLLVMLASGVPALVLWLKAHEQLVDEIERRLLTVSTLRQEQLKDYLLSETDKTELIATRILINEYLSNNSSVNESVAEIDLRSAVDVISDFKNAAIYDRNGKLKFAIDKTQFDESISEKDLDTLRTDRVRLAFPSHTPSGWMYNVSRAIFKNNTVIGVLMTWVNATKLQSLVYDKTGLQGTGELLVGVPQDQNQVHLLFPPFLDPNVTQLTAGGAMALAISGKSGIMTLRDYRGVKVIAAYRPVGFMSWGLLAKLEAHEAYAPVRSVQMVIVITICVLLFLGVIASLALAKVFSSPIIELGRAAAALGQGNMRSRVKVGTTILRDEIADLKDIFNSMAQEIASHHFMLEHKVRERTWDLARANDGLAKEIDERRRIEIELEKAKDVAISANRSKSEFLANMSHEIRTPLNAIINFTELCLDTRITPEQQEHLDYVRFAAQHLLRLITDILDFSKIEAGKLEMEEIQFSLFDQLEHAVSVLAARALKNGLELCCSFNPNVPDQIMGDPGRLLQIFVNLIGNAIKFTKKGEVVVFVSVQSKSSDSVELLFGVKDTGLGIPEDKQPLLFQAFSQVDSSTQRLYGGTGLGLVISSKLAAAMGGRMWVESAGVEDYGSTFWFTASFHIPPACNLTFTPRVDIFKNVPVLVVDDNGTSLRIMVDLLKEWGMIADGVDSVEAAKSSLQKAAEAGQNFKVLLLDMWLNGTDASELVHFICERPNLLGKSCHTASLQSGERASTGKTPNDEVVMQSQDTVTMNEHGIEDGVDLEVPVSLWHPEEPKQLSKAGNNSFNSLSSQAHGGYPDQVKPNELIIQQNLEKQDLQAVDPVAPRVARRQHFGDSSTASIVMLTSVNHTDAARCRELGINFHTSKPIKRALLLRVLQSALGAEDNPSTSDGKILKGFPESPSKSLHILVAEDNLVNQRVAVMLLQKWGHTTVLARNGAEAIEQSTKEAFDLVLMDVQMPVCDGFEATAKIRELEKAQETGGSTPIVAMTAHAMSGDGERCIAAGMDYYISKPLNAKKLQELLHLVATGSLKAHPTRIIPS